MRPSRLVLVCWSVVVLALVVLELAEITHLFTFPIATAIADPVSLVVSFVFTTIVAIIGAIFVGIFLTARLLRPRGFTPFEEEMLQMRAEVRELRDAVEELRVRPPPPADRGRGPGVR